MTTKSLKRISWLISLCVCLAAAACSSNKPHRNHFAVDSTHHGTHGTHGNPEDLDAYVSHLENPSRNGWQKPDDVVAKLFVQPGATVCDVGAGPGYFSLRLAEVVGAQGRVYAVDVEPRILGRLQERIGQSGLRNIVPILGLPDDPLLPAGVCDVVLIVNTLHHFPDPVAYLKRLGRALNQSGRIVNIDFYKRPTPMGPPVEARISAEDVVAMAEQAGLKLAAKHEELLEYQYFLEFVSN